MRDAMTDDEFLRLVDQAVEKLGPSVLSKLQNVAIVIADAPTRAQKEEMVMADDETLFGLYEGISIADRGLEEEFRLPDKITIFREPILAAYSDPADIIECVENTVWHEVAHHFGWDEEWVAKEEVKRGRTK